MEVFNYSTLTRIWDRTIILDCIGSSLGYMVLSPSWIRKGLGLELSKDLRPSLILRYAICCCSAVNWQWPYTPGLTIVICVSVTSSTCSSVGFD